GHGAGARAGSGARLDPRRRAARAAPRRAAGTAARPGRRGGGDASLVAPGRGVVRRPADILVVGAGPAAAQRRWAARGRPFGYPGNDALLPFPQPPRPLLPPPL